MAAHAGKLPVRFTDEQKLQLFSVIDDHALTGIWVINDEGRTVWTNPTGRGFYNLSADQTIGVPIEEFERRGVFRPAASLIALREHAPATVIHDTACGRVTLATANPLISQRGDVSLVIVSVTDITDFGALSAGVVAGVRRERSALPRVEPIPLAYRSAAMGKVMAVVARVATADCSVLIAGETGVGKTEIARRIHAQSPRRNKRFVSVDCGALPPSLIEAELFGYVAGAFTGSSKRDKPGLVHMADGGTLFLDEIGELPLELQAKLLQVLEEKRVRPVGAVADHRVDFRLVAASNRDLRAMVDLGRFRADLYYRMAVVTIEVPPLRHRPDDIMPIAEFHLKSAEGTYRRSLSVSTDTAQALERYAWPGNARELRNLVEGLAVMCPNAVVETADLPPYFLHDDRAAAPMEAPANPRGVPRLKDAVRKFEREVVIKAINQTGSYGAAARLLGISMPTLMRKKKLED